MAEARVLQINLRGAAINGPSPKMCGWLERGANVWKEWDAPKDALLAKVNPRPKVYVKNQLSLVIPKLPRGTPQPESREIKRRLARTRDQVHPNFGVNYPLVVPVPEDVFMGLARYGDEQWELWGHDYIGHGWFQVTDLGGGYLNHKRVTFLLATTWQLQEWEQFLRSPI